MPHVEMSALAFVAFLSRGDVHFLTGKDALISMPRLRIITRCIDELNESRIISPIVIVANLWEPFFNSDWSVIDILSFLREQLDKIDIS